MEIVGQRGKDITIKVEVGFVGGLRGVHPTLVVIMLGWKVWRKGGFA